MTQIIKKLKAKFGTPVVEETPLPDLSIWNTDDKGNPTTPVYIETAYISEQSNEFRKDYRKVITCITTITNGNQVPACRKLYNTFSAKWKLNDADLNLKSQHLMLSTTICGYIENLLQQLETQYAYVYTEPKTDEVLA